MGLLPLGDAQVYISSGVPCVDNLVGGSGFEPGHIYEVFGPPGSGKTQLALSLAAHSAPSARVLYLDVKGDFSAERLSQIIGERGGQVNACLGKVRVKRIFTLGELIEALDCIESFMEGGGKTDPFWASTRLLVIDNVASLVYPEMDEDDQVSSTGGCGRANGDGMKEIFGRVEVAVGALQRLASEQQMCVLVINNAVAGGGDYNHDEGGGADCRPSLGRILSNAADVRLKVVMVDGSSARAVYVDRGIRLAPGSMCKITVTERGWDELS